MDSRLIVDPPGSGSWNMAVDEALLESAAQHGGCTLRFYQWSEPTLSLGYFQAYADRQLHQPSLSCGCQRRTTGGGAILHDRELTYSFTAPAPAGQRAGVQQFYNRFHQTLVEELKEQGVAAELYEVPDLHVINSSHFLCFMRRTTGDVVSRGHKVAGSAQRRHRRAVLQHGSVLLERSAAAPELPGLREISGQTLLIEPLLRGWTRRLEAATGLRPIQAPLAPAEVALAESLQARKFSHPAWLHRR